MIKINMEFEKEFVNLYNKFNSTEKGKEFLSLSGISRDKLDIAKSSKLYFKNNISDISIDPNSNVGNRKNQNTFTNEMSKSLMKLDGYYLIWKYIRDKFDIEKANELISNSINGKYYIHDITKINIPYCIATNTYNIMLLGRPYGNLQSRPAKRSSSFIAQCIEHLMSLSQEQAGAVAFGDLLINYSKFIHDEYNGYFENNIIDENDKNIDIVKKIENDFQSFVHVANNNFRIGGDSPFSNISLYCRTTIENIFKTYRYPDGTSPLDILNTIMNVQYIFMKFISMLDPITKMPYRFPIVTCNLNINKETREINDKLFLEQLAECNTEGVFNIFITNDKAKIASCCRMLNDKTELMKYSVDSFGNGGMNLGSHRVVTINLVRLSRESNSFEEFKLKVKNAMFEVAKILIAHRCLIKDRIEQNFLMFFKPLEWLNLDSMFFSTIGVNGIYEAFNYLNIDIIKNQNEVINLFEYCNDVINELANKYKVPFNLEQIPAEGAAVDLAKKDRLYFGENTNVLYSNQFIPLWKDIDLVERAKIDGKLSKLFGGGVISHLNISSKTNKEQMIKLINFASFCGLDHFALNMCFSKCENNHVSSTNSNICPICGKKIIDKVTRIVGYFTPVNNWITERREYEFNNRKFGNLDL